MRNSDTTLCFQLQNQFSVNSFIYISFQFFSDSNLQILPPRVISYYDWSRVFVDFEKFIRVHVLFIVYLQVFWLQSCNMINTWSHKDTVLSYWVFNEVPIKIYSWWSMIKSNDSKLLNYKHLSNLHTIKIYYIFCKWSILKSESKLSRSNKTTCKVDFTINLRGFKFYWPKVVNQVFY